MTRKNDSRKQTAFDRAVHHAEWSMERTSFVTTVYRNPLSSVGPGNRKSSYYVPSVATNRWTVEQRIFAYKTDGILERNRYGSFDGDLMSVDIPFDDECDFETVE